MNLAARFKSNILKINPPIWNGTRCWIWTGAKQPEGYGRTWVNGKKISTHRAVYELLVGPIPEGLDLDHLCRNRACCNPKHLEPVTRSENLRRGNAGRHTLVRLRSRTHCDKGHEFNDSNTRWEKYKDSTIRVCAACRKAKYKRANDKKKLKRKEGNR